MDSYFWALRRQSGGPRGSSSCTPTSGSEINADGNWVLTMLPLVLATQVDGSSGSSFSGTGDLVFWFVLEDAPAIIDFSCGNCSSNIFVRAYGAGGRDGLINEIGDGTLFNATVVVPVGTFFLEVETNDGGSRGVVPGDWTINVQ